MKRISFIAVALLSATNMYGLWEAPQNISIPMEVGAHGYIVAPAAQYDLAYKAFDNNKDQADLNTLVFGKNNIQVKDIYLASKLAGLGKTNNTDNTYLDLISTCTVDMNLQQERFKFSIGGSVTFNFMNTENTTMTIAVDIPVEYYQHKISARYLYAKLGADNGTSTTGSGRFFVHNGSLEDFMNREILEPRGLKRLGDNRTFGIGSPRIAAVLDVSQGWDSQIEKLQFGASARLKAPEGDRSNIVWAARRGVGGHYLGGNVNVAWNLKRCLRPFFSLESTKSFYHAEKMRIPTQRTRLVGGSTGTFSANNILVAGPHKTVTLKTGESNTFTLYDSTVPFFAEQAIMVEQRRGSRSTLQVGNRMNLKNRCDLSLYYQLYHKSKDSLKLHADAPSGTYDLAMMTNRTNQISHTMGWLAQYGLEGGAALSVGSSHVIKGENTPQYHSFFFILESAF